MKESAGVDEGGRLEDTGGRGNCGNIGNAKVEDCRSVRREFGNFINSC